MKKIIAIFIALVFIIPFFSQADKNKIERIINEVDENLLYSYVRTIQDFGEHPTGSEECEKVGQFIFNEFKKFGLETEYFEWTAEKYEGKNIIATLHGEDNSIVIISAHYDSYPTSPGADDDGSGIACLLMAAKIMSKYYFRHTIKFVAFSGEEQGMLGSKAYVSYLYEKGEDIIADLNVDTVGHAVSAEGGSLIRVITDEASLWITDIAEEMSIKHNIGLSLYRHGNFPAGDHQPFIDYGYEAVFFVEYEFNTNMHTPNDTVEHINKSYLGKVCKLILATLAEIADKKFSLRIKFKEPKIGYLYFGNREIMKIGKTIVIGRIYSKVVALENEGIKRIEFYFDGELKGFCYELPGEYIYMDKAFLEHEIKAIAIGKENDICRIKIFVINFLPAGPPH